MLKLTDLLPNRVELDPESHYRWQVWVGILMYALLVSSAAIWTAMFIGLPKLGRLSWENDRQPAIDRAMSKSIGPIELQISTLTTQVNEQTKVSKAFLATLAEDNLLTTHARMCELKTFSTEWMRLSSDFERFRLNYKDATGSEYRQLYCDEARQ